MLPALALGTKLTNEHRGSTLSLATLPEIKYSDVESAQATVVLGNSATWPDGRVV